MSENKFIRHLRGEDTSKSVLEIKNQRTTTSFANMPQGTSNANDVYSDHRGNATGVLKGSDNWKLNNSALLAATDVHGDGRDFTSTYTASGNTLWVDSTFTFDSEKMFTPNTKFVLKLCGFGLNSAMADTIDFTLVVKLGSSIVVSKDFKVKEQAFEFSQEFDIDFDESNTTSAKFTSGDTMQVQLLCGDPTASATIYNGMTVFTALQRRVDGDSVASDKKTFDEAVQDIDDINEELDDLEQYVDDTFVRLDGTSIMTGPLKMAAGSMRGAFSPYFNGVAFWKMDSQNNITQIATLSDTQFLPATTNATNLGNSTKKWKDLYLDGKAYVATINNGADVAVPAYTGTMVVADFTGGVSGQFLQLNNSLQPVWHTVVLNDISDVDTSNVSSGQVLEYDGTKWAPSNVLINNYSIDAGNYTAGSGTYAITRFSLILEKPDGSWEKPTDTTRNYTTDTDKAVNTNGFLLNQIKYYNHTSTLGNGAVTAMNKVYSKAASVPMSYSTNCGTTTNWTLGSWVYLVGSIGADGLFYLDTAQWWSDALPTTNDGKVYIQLGKVASSGTSSIALLQDRPIYFHDGTGIREYIPEEDRFVHKQGNEEIDGAKKFLSSVYRKIPYTYNEVLASTSYFGYYVCDKNNVTIGTFEAVKTTTGENRVQMNVYGPTGTWGGGLGLGMDANGNTFTYAPTPNNNDNSTKIATTEHVLNVLKNYVYPVGSIYIGTTASCPLAALFGTWELIQGRYLLSSGTLAGTSETYVATNTVASGLPQVSGTVGVGDGWSNGNDFGSSSGAFAPVWAIYGRAPSNGEGSRYRGADFYASRSSAVFNQSLAVRAPAYVVNVWRRTA